jgi:hypothetical protein
MRHVVSICVFGSLLGRLKYARDRRGGAEGVAVKEMLTNPRRRCLSVQGAPKVEVLWSIS